MGKRRLCLITESAERQEGSGLLQIFPDGYTVVYFNNQDIKQTYPDGKVVYFFAEARTTQTTYTDNLQVFKFQNGQIEKHFPDGTKEIK